MLANPLAYAASRDPDTMYVDQALRAPDKKEFLKAMQKEVRSAHRKEALGTGTTIGGTSVPTGLKYCQLCGR